MAPRRATLLAVAEPAPNNRPSSSRIAHAQPNRQRSSADAAFSVRPHDHSMNGPPVTPGPNRSRSTVAYWKQRLINRPYPEARLGVGTEYSVRMEQEGSYNYFPLGSNCEDVAAAKALEIHRAILRRGWQIATEQFEREITLAIF